MALSRANLTSTNTARPAAVICAVQNRRYPTRVDNVTVEAVYLSLVELALCSCLGRVYGLLSGSAGGLGRFPIKIFKGHFR